uniref:BTB domain-containing protein n=1 Tax=Globodera rostochiensis TaxID=31243 RepID=A0A914HIX1_GLORO
MTKQTIRSFVRSFVGKGCRPMDKNGKKETKVAKDEAQKKQNGRIAFCVPRFSDEFVNKEVAEVQQKVSHSVDVRGLPWHIVVGASSSWNRYSKCLDLFVRCNGDTSKETWSCLASVKLRIKAQREGKEDNECALISQMFSANQKEAGYCQLMDFEVLMNPENGWHNERDDSITLEADIQAEPPRGVITIPKSTNLLVNGEAICVNKELLSAHSSYFKTLFFSNDFRESKTNEFKLKIEEPSANVRDFERLMAVMYPVMCPEYKPIDGRAASALFKHRLSEKYGYGVLKAHVLRNLVREDFEGDKFGENVSECFKLGENGAFGELLARYRELYPPGTELE